MTTAPDAYGRASHKQPRRWSRVDHRMVPFPTRSSDERVAIQRIRLPTHAGAAGVAFKSHALANDSRSGRVLLSRSAYVIVEAFPSRSGEVSSRSPDAVAGGRSSRATSWRERSDVHGDVRWGVERRSSAQAPSIARVKAWGSWSARART
jgi:hypothetical protein